MSDPSAPGPAGPPPTSKLEWGLLGGLAVAVTAVVIGTRWGVFTPDTRPDLYQNPGRFLASSVQAWVGGANGLGQSNFNAGAAPVAVVVWFIRLFGVSPWMAVRIWRLLLLLVAAAGIRKYLGVVFGARLSVAGRMVATVFWVANPYIVVAGNTTPVLLPYALLPWTLIPFVQSTRHPRSWRWPAVFALAFFAQAGLNAGVVSFFSLLVLPAHIVYAVWVERRPRAGVFGALAKCGLLTVLVSLYWLAPSFLATGTGTGIAEATENPVDVARTSSYGESARLLGHWPLYGRAGSRLFLGGYASYIDNPFVVVCSFLILLAVGATLVWSRGRERLLVVGMIVMALPAMVGLFPPDKPYPAGRFLGKVFEAVPATLAFRTTNKAGAVVVLAYAVALSMGVRAFNLRRPTRGLRVAGVALTMLVLVGASLPMWSGNLYPLGYKIPTSWKQALGDLDARDPQSRVMVVPGGTGGNYRWGMRSPDDLFPSLLERPVAVRNTVVGRGNEAGNFLAGFDTLLAQGALAPSAISTTARYLGAAQVLVRNDLLTEEIGGPSPAVVDKQVQADPGLTSIEDYGPKGQDTLPGVTGKATAAQKKADPRDAALTPVSTYQVDKPEPVVRSVPVTNQVLVDGDGESFSAMSWASLLNTSPTVRYMGDLNRATLKAALHDGARLVMTDTNRRRAWDINRITNATSATLGARDDIDAGNGATVTLWPDNPTKQTVTEVLGVKSIEADLPAFGLHPYGRAGQAFDGDPTTGWQTGGLGTAAGDQLKVTLNGPTVVTKVSVTPLNSAPSRVSSISVRMGATVVVQPIPAGSGPITIPVPPTRTTSVIITILSQTPGSNPVGIAEVAINELKVREVTRLPRTLVRLADKADAATRKAIAAAPLDVVFTRARGSVADLTDDEESQLDRRFELPGRRTFLFTAELSVNGADPELVASLRRGSASARACQQVAVLDDGFIKAKVVSTKSDLARGLLKLEGCAPITLGAGRHQMLGIFGWRLDRARFSSAAPDDSPVPDAGADDSYAYVTSRTDTRITADLGPASSDARFVRIGEAFDPRWTLTVDGKDAGPPTVLDGYSVGWRVDGGKHHIVVGFTPQGAVRTTFVLSAAGVVGVVAIALLPTPAFLEDRRRRRDGRRT